MCKILNINLLTSFNANLGFLRHLLFIVLFWLKINFLFGQIDREFWFAIPKETSGNGNANLNATNNISFKITPLNLSAYVTISMPANPAFKTRTVFIPAGKTHIEVLATNWAEFEAIYNNSAAQDAEPVTSVTNHGILITSDNDILVYYDFDNYYNRDLFSLKGRDALGTDFYTPFQNIWNNDMASYDPDPYSSIEIVATEDGTTVEIHPTKDYIFQGRSDALPWKISLNRGECYSLRASSVKWSSHPSGTHIVSNKNIAISINDDSVLGANYQCRDIIGDQLVPTNRIGSKYIVQCSDRTRNIIGIATKNANRGEQIFVTATQPYTIIEFRDRTGILLYTTDTMGPGEQDYFSINTAEPTFSSIFIKATDPSKKFYVLHTTGIGCEIGGAIVPPITDCSGSNEVNFYRSATTNEIAINLMVPLNKSLSFNDTAQSYKYFKLVRYNSSRVDTISIPGAWFESNDSAGWAVLKINNRNINSITIIGATHKLINSKDFFHFGMTNGTSGQTNKYGYFSSFNPTQADVYSPQTQTNNFIGCYGDTITLLAKGGLGYTWHYGSPDGPPTYLSDFKSAYPSIINCPIGNHLFFTEINHGKCFSVDTLRVSVNINPIPLASFAVDKTTVCSPELVTFKDQSVNADFYFWQKQTLSNTWEDIKLSDTINPRQFTLLVFTDNKLYFQDIAYKLIATSKFGCTDDTSIILTAYPQLVADFSPKDTIGVPPLQISFKDNSQIFGKPSYTWISNDIVFSSKLTATQIFKNLTSDIVTYYLKLIVKNDYCADTAFGTVRVLTLANKIEPIDIQKELNIYPVPAIDNLNINFKNSKPGNIKLEITSLSGKVIYSTIQYLKTSGESTITIPTKKIPDNLFIIRLYKDSKMFICKGMKK